MVSEDVQKILALIIVTLSFLALPVLLFFFALALYVNATYVIQFYHTRDFADGLIAALLAVVNAGVLWTLRALIKWIREK
ncbi:MAG: hypothetical protein JSV57_00255 [Candidatus Bathyarchaeota archaeon]|nr:MAG: hypothetical protein JSV57_00255 [Candidatus Bathyarchaeota archaeon]